MKPDKLLSAIYQALESCGMKWDRKNQFNSERLGFERCYKIDGYYAEVEDKGSDWKNVHVYGKGFRQSNYAPYPTTFGISNLSDVMKMKNILRKEFENNPQ